MNAVIIFGAPRSEGNFMASLETVSVSRRTLAPKKNHPFVTTDLQSQSFNHLEISGPVQGMFYLLHYKYE
jgi:hypothetical protein